MLDLRGNSITTRATGDLTGQNRYVLVDRNNQVHQRTTFPTRRTALSFRINPDHEVRGCIVTGRSGPFSDTVEVFEPCQCGRLTGSDCEWEGPRKDTVLLEEHGVRLSRDCAEALGQAPR